MRVVLAIASVAAVAGFCAPEAEPQYGRWYWTPGWCKSMLKNYGMEFPDGRYFYASQAFCVGRGGLRHCEWNASYTTRLYNRFVSFAQAGDGVVRAFELYVTGRSSYYARNVRAFGYVDPDLVNAYIGRLARRAAYGEHEKGCAPYGG